MTHKTDVVIIGSGPVGLFAVFELGLLNLKAHLIDNLDRVGGQCAELYPEKPIYDIPAYPKITGQELTDKLISQIKPFEPTFHLNQQADSIEKIDDGWKIVTSEGTTINARCIVIAAGAGSFVPRKPPIDNITEFEGTSVFYAVRNKELFKNKKILIVGGGDSALDWTNDLATIADVTLMHRRKEFRAAPDSVNKMLNLEKEGKIKFLHGQLKSLSGKNKIIKEIKYSHEEKEYSIEADYFGIPCINLDSVEEKKLTYAVKSIKFDYDFEDMYSSESCQTISKNLEEEYLRITNDQSTKKEKAVRLQHQLVDYILKKLSINSYIFFEFFINSPATFSSNYVATAINRFTLTRKLSVIRVITKTIVTSYFLAFFNFSI